MIEADDNERIRFGLVEHAPEPTHRGDGRVELRRILTGLAQKQRGRMA
jgi:hypothetical protein